MKNHAWPDQPKYTWPNAQLKNRKKIDLFFQIWQSIKLATKPDFYEICVLNINFYDLWIFIDDLSEDLSLGLILDDRDDSLFGGTWSDEEDDACTPTKHLPTLGMFFLNFVRIQNMFYFF